MAFPFPRRRLPGRAFESLCVMRCLLVDRDGGTVDSGHGEGMRLQVEWYLFCRLPGLWRLEGLLVPSLGTSYRQSW
jgi:hypothetical protein